ncbi:MAG: hypothetical protein EA427_01210 [Spirochaetaceae bacterium]|nr:MAG: hypothetical protein EA427_01210 [Spirochaetaceae bacterium]
MSSLARTLAGGYRTMAARLSWFLLGLLALVLVSGAITLPVWLLASRTPRLFTALFLLGATAALVKFVHKRYTRSERRGRGRWMMVTLVCLAAALVIWGISGRSILLSAGGLLFFSMIVAWNQGPR